MDERELMAETSQVLQEISDVRTFAALTVINIKNVSRVSALTHLQDTKKATAPKLVLISS